MSIKVEYKTGYAPSSKLNKKNKQIAVSNPYRNDKKNKPINYMLLEFDGQTMAEGDHREIYLFEDKKMLIREFNTLDLTEEKVKGNSIYHIDINTLMEKFKSKQKKLTL